jgi:hypothetical protein
VLKPSAPEAEEDSESDKIEENETSESLSESSDDDDGSKYSDESKKEKTQEPGTPIQPNDLLASGSFLGRAVFTPDSTLPIGMKRSGQVMLYAVPYDHKVHKNVLHTPMSVKWSEDLLEASPPKKRRQTATKVSFLLILCSLYDENKKDTLHSTFRTLYVLSFLLLQMHFRTK